MAVFCCLDSRLPAEARWPFFGPAVPAVDWSVWSWFKWKLGNFSSAFRTFPVSLDHLPRAKTAAALIVFIKHLCIANF